MLNRRVMLIALCGLVIVAASAMYALACSPSPPRQIAIQLQSLTIDGVEQTDLMKYQKVQSFITPTDRNGRPDSVNIYYGTEGEAYDPK